MLLLACLAGCGSTEKSVSQRLGDLDEARAELKGELLLVEVEAWSLVYTLAHAKNEPPAERRALAEVRRAAHACLYFGITECDEIRDIEGIVQKLEAQSHKRLPITSG